VRYGLCNSVTISDALSSVHTLPAITRDRAWSVKNRFSPSPETY